MYIYIIFNDVARPYKVPPCQTNFTSNNSIRLGLSELYFLVKYVADIVYFLSKLLFQLYSLGIQCVVYSSDV